MIPCLLKLEDRSRFVLVFWKELFFSCTWNSSEVKPDLGADQFLHSDYNLFQRLRMFGEKPTPFQDVSISLRRHEVTPQRTRRNWSSKSGLKHLRDVYVTFIHYLLSLWGLFSPTSWTDRSFELNLLLLVFTQAFHKISIQTSIKKKTKQKTCLSWHFLTIPLLVSIMRHLICDFSPTLCYFCLKKQMLRFFVFWSNDK